MSDIKIEDVSGTPRSVDQLEAALRWVEAELIFNPVRMGPKDTGPAVMHLLVCRDLLRACLLVRRTL